MSITSNHKTLPELAKMLGISRQAMSSRVRKWGVPFVKVGRAKLIRTEDLPKLMVPRIK
jgi:biotin operon repressor